MECLLVPEKSQTKTVLVRHGGKGKCCSGRVSSHLGKHGGVFVLVLLICVPNLYLILRTEKLRSEVSLQKDIIDTLIQKCQQTGNPLEQWESVHNHKNHHKIRNSTSSRSKRSGCGTATFVHLVGGGECYNEARKFKWTRGDGEFTSLNPTDIEYVEDGEFITAIRIRESGFYMVYSKIHAKGRKKNDNTPNASVGFLLKVDRQLPSRTIDSLKLSKSFITQDQRGKPYSSIHTVNGYLTPVDEVTDMGIYHLEEHDEIYIEASADGNNFDWLCTKDLANFGILRLCS